MLEQAYAWFSINSVLASRMLCMEAMETLLPSSTTLVCLFVCFFLVCCNSGEGTHESDGMGLTPAIYKEVDNTVAPRCGFSQGQPTNPETCLSYELKQINQQTPLQGR